MKFILKLISSVIKLLNSFIPKSKNKILFISRPDFADNAYYMYRYMVNTDIDKQFSWIIYDKRIYQLLLNKGLINIFYLKSISGIWEYTRCKYIITSSSSLWQIKSPFQKQYDLWHGIPLKNVLCMGEKGIEPKRQAENITRRFATSTLTKALLAASFDYNAMKIEITGQPRTDALFCPKSNLESFLNINIKKYKKIIIYMPTYRHGYRSKSEGERFDNENIFRMKGYNHKNFLKYLERESILFLLKLHPYEEKLYKDIDLGKNIFWITNENMITDDINIYDVLAYVDILITDYSSVYFDFLLLDRKIIFVPVDLDFYKKNRGFELEPYEYWTPGKKVFDQNLLEEVILSDDTDDEKRHREEIKNIMFYHKDGNSAHRVFNFLSQNQGLIK